MTKYEYGYAIFDSGRILIETYIDGVFQETGFTNADSLELEKIGLDMEGYIYSEECTNKVKKRIEDCKNRMKSYKED